MSDKLLHVADEELLLYSGGELRAIRRSQILAHLEICPECQTRLENLDGALSDFGEAQRNATGELPPALIARVRLETRLAELAAHERTKKWPHAAWSLLADHRLEAVAVAVIAICSVLILMRGQLEREHAFSASLGQWDEPNLRLTPGATIPVTIAEVCGQDSAEGEVVIPVSLRHQVFQRYGVTTGPDAYEVDYLITPELGGATDVRNLWPEPYGDTVWNAHVKDQLENRLHQMVCRGDVDLATAQHDISTDWIAAYRKYFHADTPLSEHSSSNSSPPGVPFRALSFYKF